MFSAPYIDIIIFAILAVFLIFRLRSVLGRRDGFDEKPDDEAKRAVFKKSDPSIKELDAVSGKGIAAVVAADAHFSQQDFLDGAGLAYKMILEGFAKGDMDQLKPLLGYDIATDFGDAIRDRRKAGEVLRIELVDLRRVDLLRAWVEAGIAFIAVEFHSTQKKILRDEAGKIIEGSDEAEMFVDQWVFERDVTSKNPNWLLVETQIGSA